MTEAVRIWFLALFGLGFVMTLAGFIRFRAHRGAVEHTVGPFPTPGPIVVSSIGLLILLTATGSMSGRTAGGWLALRGLGVGLSLYALVVLPMAVRALGRFGIPGIAVLRDHGLVTSGPFRRVRHPGYSGVLALWLGAALGTLNWLMLGLWPLLVAVLLKVAREEETLLRRKLGARYEEYAARTGRFVPRVTRPRRVAASADDR